MEDKKYTAKLPLSRREQEVVKGFAENWLARHNLNEYDARQKIYETIVRHKYKDYTLRGQRLTRTPMWNVTFGKNLCPTCNSDEQIFKEKDLSYLNEDGENLKCSKCEFKIGKTLWAEGRKANETEKKIREDDKIFSEKIGKFNIPKERLDELAKKGIMEAQRASRIRKSQDEQD